MTVHSVIFLAWTLLGIFFFSQSLVQKFFSGSPTPWWHYLFTWMTGAYLSAALTPVVLWLGRRIRIERKNWASRAVAHVLLSVAFAVVALAVHSALLPWMGVFPAVMRTFQSTFVMLLVVSFHQNVITYWMILGIQYAVGYYRKYQEREKQALILELHSTELKAQLMRAQLSALKMQLQPHFLFNTLNAIMVLVRQQKNRNAEDTLARLSDLLRCVLEDVQADEVPLRRELEYLELYLSIEQVRFQDRLRVEIAADAVTLDAAVPHMSLQPIVENAIRHGIGRSSSAGRLQISASRIDGNLEIKVVDDGPGLDPLHASRTGGIGLANTKERLRQLYGDSAQITLGNGSSGGAVATLVLPYRLISGGAEAELVEAHGFDHAHR